MTKTILVQDESQKHSEPEEEPESFLGFAMWRMPQDWQFFLVNRLAVAVACPPTPAGFGLSMSAYERRTDMADRLPDVR
jgi:hypothetical protein